MRKPLHFTFLLVAAWCLSFAGLPSASASHFQGGQLTYEAVPGVPNRYKFTLRVFRDCGGATLYPTATFTFRSAGCSAATGDPAAATVNLIGGSTIGTPYCSSAPGNNGCGTGLPTNYETGRYEYEVTLPPRAEWRISVNDNARPEVANITGQLSIHYEATLNNLVGGQTIQNNSAQFDLLNVPVPFVCWKQQTTLNFTATDADGDELVYSLEQPLENCNDPILYKTIGSVGPYIDLTAQNGGSPCIGVLPSGGTGTYSAAFPIASFSFTGSCPVRTAVPNFQFSPSTGSFTFTPYLYTNQVNSALNKYAVVGKVAEYRVINGVRRLIGSVRRDIFVVVIDCSNTIPGAPVATGNNTNSGVTIRNTSDSTFIEASTCNYTRVLVRFTDPDPNDLLSVTFPTLVASAPGQPTYLPEDVGTFQVIGNGTRRPVGIFDIQPDVFYKDQTFRIPVQIRDNGCPIIGQQTRVIILSVRTRNPARVVAAANNTFICANTTISLTATPTRPDSVLLGIGTPMPRPLQADYGYTWDPADGLATADLNKQNIMVRPTQTTRYRVRINARDFRQIPSPTCVDTSSILVRVAPAIAARFTAVGRASFTQAGITNVDQIPPRIFTCQNTSTVPRPNPTDTAAVTSVWTYQRITNGSEETVTEPETIFSRRFTSRELTLREAGKYRIKLRITNRAGTTDCPASEAVQEVDVPTFTTPNVFTPNKDGKNDVFVLTTEEEGGKVQIFNRWGRLVKEYASYRNDWDGADQPAGVYYYLLTSRSGRTSKGWVELAR
ncbi:MAG: gliding motility-associated C-terminal domain-containing protein [Hymenobacter sp.]|nr:gliding motility-associated C-terminal domain-containing protein [Hymenobacter sp.]